MSATPGRHFVRDLGRAVSWHRRKLAVVAVVAAVITGISAARPPDPPTVTVVRTTRELPAGATLSTGDLRVDHVPRAAAPDKAVLDPVAVAGATVRAPLADRAMLTELDTGTPRASSAAMVIAPLRLDDVALADLVRVGDRVDVIASADSRTKARVLASRVLVVGLPRPPDDSLSQSGSTGALLLVEVDLRTATALTETTTAGRVSIVLR